MKRSVIVSAFLPTMACAFCLGGCTYPLALIGQHGEIYRGTFTNSLGSDRGISMSNGKTTCSNQAGDINVLHCSDGRTGIVTYTDCGKDNGICGGGRVRFSDGTEADFTLGGAASRI
jgi:hypothetical protein